MAVFFVFIFVILIFAFALYFLYCLFSNKKIEFSGGYLLFAAFSIAVLGLYSTITIDDENISKIKSIEKKYETERDNLLDFIKSTQEYGDRMMEFASLAPGDLVFDLDDRAYIVMRVAEEVTEPYVGCRDLALSGDMTILIEKKDGWKYKVMRKDDGLYKGTLMDILAPSSVPDYE